MNIFDKWNSAWCILCYHSCDTARVMYITDHEKDYGLIVSGSVESKKAG